MTRILTLTLIGILSLNYFVYSQIENEISSYVDSTEITINNGRRLLVSKVQAGELEKVLEIYNYLGTKTAEKNCAAFYFDEEMYIFTLLGQWDYWLKYAEEYIKIQSKPMCYSNSYVIDELLYRELELKQKELVENVTNSTIFEEEKAVILLYLYIVENKKADEIYKQKLKDFKNKFPNSKYQVFIDRYLPKPTIKAAMGYCFGSTIVFPTNHFSDLFSSNGTFLMSIDFNSGKVFTSLYFNGGSLKLKEPITASSGTIVHNFNEGESFSDFEGGFMGGYFLVRNNYLQVAPYFTLAGTSLESDMYESSSNEPEIKLIGSFTYGPGLHTELKFYQSKPQENPTYYPYYYYMKNYFSFKADVGYNVIASPEIFKGNILYVRLGIVWGIGEF